MALSVTTLSAAVAAGDLSILIASLTGLEVGDVVIIDQEVMKVLGPLPSAATSPVSVLRGQDGTRVVAHVSGANVVHGKPSEFAQAAAGAAQMTAYPAVRHREKRSYSADGAIALPTPGNDMAATLIGTVALAMTVAVPGVDQDGDKLLIQSNGKAAHTVDFTGGLGANTTNSDRVTFNANQRQAIEVVASNGVWNLIGVVAGAATVAGAGLG